MANRGIVVGSDGRTPMGKLRDITHIKRRAGAQPSTVGISGSGEVVALRGTGQETMDTPVYEIDLMVTVAGGEPYKVTHRHMIDSSSLGDWKLGTIHPVRVSTTDPSQVMIGEEPRSAVDA